MKDQKNDRRSQRTRRLLNTALFELMQKKHYDDITVQDILDQADVGRSTFYAHYQGKEELLISGLDSLLDHFVDHLNTNAVGAPLMIELFRHVQQNQNLYRAVVWGRGAELLYGKGQDLLSRKINSHLASRAGGRQPGVPLDVVSEYLSGAFFSLLRWWVDNRFPYTPEQMNDMFQSLAVPSVLSVLGGSSFVHEAG